LLTRKLIGTMKLPVKILGGELKIKDVKFERVRVSESVKKQLEEQKHKNTKTQK